VANRPAGLSESSERGLRRGTVSAGEKLSKNQRTLPDQAGPDVKGERWVEFWFQEALSWRALRLPAKSPNSNCSKPLVPETPSYQSGRASDRPVEAFKRRCPGEAHGFGESRNGGSSKTRKTGDSKAIRQHRHTRYHRARAHWGAEERRGRQALG